MKEQSVRTVCQHVQDSKLMSGGEKVVKLVFKFSLNNESFPQSKKLL